MCQFESEKEIAELLASLGVAAATSHLCTMPPSCDAIDPIDANYWRNQFVSDDFTQIDYDDTLHAYQCAQIRPYPNKSFNWDSKMSVRMKAPRHGTVVSPRLGVSHSESKLPPAKQTEITSTPLSSPVQGSEPSQLEMCFKELATLGGSLAAALGGSIAAPPKKVTISLTFEL